MSHWFRLSYDFATSSTVQMLSEVDQRRFVMLLAITAKYPNSPISDRDMAWRMRIADEEWLETKARLVEKGLATCDNVVTYDGVGDALLRPSPAVWAEIRTRIFARDDYTCRYCGERGKALQCDHVVPVTRGGDHSDENLVTACEPCNRAKRDKIISIDEFSAARRGRS